MLTVFFVVGLYTYYLYINIRQLFKAIIAISKGNYERRIRLLINVFTPFEIVSSEMSSTEWSARFTSPTFSLKRRIRS